ncbi:MAG: hydrogenase maturation nickel metallochaperone HypA [Thermoleophilia bacterium]
MHEVDITQSILDLAREAAASAGANTVSDLYIVGVAATDVSEESIRSSFAALARSDDVLRHAKLHFGSEPVAATCLACGDEFVTETPQPICPQCGSREVRLDLEAVTINLGGIGGGASDIPGSDGTAAAAPPAAS